MVFAIAAAGTERLVQHRNLAAAGHAQYFGTQGGAYAAPFAQVQINNNRLKMQIRYSLYGHYLHLYNRLPGKRII